ncbi:hypothetical protein EV363DRAFT_1476831 [Boletus edulis]|nr:hypothetical protein EV363DRAFT_1476831 [Boletus edulis]
MSALTDGITFVTWPSTPAANTTGAPSFFRLSGSLSQGAYETQETGTSVEFHRPSFKLPVQLAQGHSPVLPLPPPNREGFGLKLILAYDQGVVCKLTAWRDTADAWRGLGPSPGLKRGKLVYFESTSFIPIDLMHI